jgi:ATP-binding cassette, subfamily B, bacterial HlyB/CyaB
MRASDITFTFDELLWLLGSLCALYRTPFDAKLIERDFPPPHNLASLHEAARALDFKTGDAHHPADWKKFPYPAIAFLPEVCETKTDGASQVSERRIPVLLLKGDANKLLYLRAGMTVPETITVIEAKLVLAQEIILVARDSETIEGSVPGFEIKKAAFGFRWFIPELLKHRRIWRDIILASLSIQLVGLATPLFTQVIIDKVIVHQTQSTLIAVGIALILFLFFTSSMTWLRQYLVLHTGNRIDAVLGAQVFRHLLRLPLPYFEQRPTGTLVARLHGVETIREFISGAAVTLVLDLPFLLIFLAVMFAYSWQLSLIAVGLLGAIAIVSALVVPTLRRKLDRQFMLGAHNQAFLTEYVAGMTTVKSLQMEADVEKKYADNLASYLAAGFSTRQVSNTYSVISNGIEQVMTLAILMVGALLVMNNDGFTVGMLVAFQMFVGRMSQPLLRMVGLWQEFQQADIAVKRLGDILDVPQESHTLIPSREPQGGGRIELQDLAFRYSEHHPYLYRELNLTFKPGRLTVLMGASGCGKSTLAKLLLGFYQPTEGRILMDGKDIHHLATNELRATFGVVPQETVLFSGTLYDNLIMAYPHASFDDVLRACKAAEIHDDIERLPNGYQTLIGERGTGLSGGQRQRIAIARALLKRAQILVFDEAVSNLDQQTAEQFAKTINKLKGRVTLLFITHQIPRALNVDEVIELGSNPLRSIEVTGAGDDEIYI